MGDQKKVNKLTEDNRRKLKEKQEKIRDLPMNKFLNGNLPSAAVLRNYHEQHLEPVITKMRVVKGGIEDIRHYKLKLQNYKKQYTEGPIIEKNQYGLVMTKEEVHNEITKIGNVLIDERLTDIRTWIADGLMAMIDDVFVAEKFDEFVMNCINVLKGDGYDLFPKEIELIKIK